MASAETTGQGGRGLLVGALVVLGGTTGAAFGRVFAGAAPSVRLVAAGGLAVAVAGAMQRRGLLLSLLAGAAALFWVLALFVFPGTVRYGLPTLDTYDALARVLGRVTEDALREIAPAPALPSLMTAGILAVWTAATASHALAVRSRSPILALFPGAALLAFAGVVAEDGPRPGYVAAFLLAGAAVLFGAGLSRMEVWGPLLRRPGDRRLPAIAGPTGRWARWMALAATAIAVVLPGILPGYQAGPLVDVDAHGDRAGVGVSPIVDIRPALLRTPPAVLFTVRAPRPAYWRLLSLDRFTGHLWTATDLEASDGEVVSGKAVLPNEGGIDSTVLRQEYVIDELATPWLPAAFEPVGVGLDITGPAGGAAFHDDDAEMLVRRDGTVPGYRYRVTSQLVVPDAEDLEGAFEGTSLERFDRYLQLPPDLPPQIPELARQIAGDARTPFRQILGIQNYLRTFTYDEKAPAGHGSDHMVNFLTETQRGFCEQFAGTMAVLVRSLGYPARVAVGFLPGQPDDSGRWVVTTEETHAWVEVYFPGYGWLAFEPTPTRSNPVASYLAPPGGLFRTDPGLPARGEVATTQGVETSAEAREAFADPGSPTGFRGSGSDRRPAERPWGRLLLGLLTLGALAAVGLPLGKALARRLVLSRATTPRHRILAAWSVLEAGASDLGLGRETGETLLEYRARLRSRVAFSDGHLDRVTGLAGLALYAQDRVGPGDADEAAAALRATLRDLRRHAGPARTVAGAIRPSGPV